MRGAVFAAGSAAFSLVMFLLAGMTFGSALAAVSVIATCAAVVAYLVEYATYEDDGHDPY